MATRAIIQVIGANYAQVYKHWDGNPSSILPWLIEFAWEFSEERGHDPEYCLAQLLRSSVFLGEKYKLDDSHHTGRGARKRKPTRDNSDRATAPAVPQSKFKKLRRDMVSVVIINSSENTPRGVTKTWSNRARFNLDTITEFHQLLA